MYHSMTAADLCSMYKPWSVCTQLVHVIMEEFWLQVSVSLSLSPVYLLLLCDV